MSVVPSPAWTEPPCTAPWSRKRVPSRRQRPAGTTNLRPRSGGTIRMRCTCFPPPVSYTHLTLPTICSV
eukprot:6920935-Prorocentrum_lima.AAC.1